MHVYMLVLLSGVTVTHRNPVVEVDEGAGSVEVCGTLKNNAGSSVTTEKIIRVAYSTVPGTAIGRLHTSCFVTSLALRPFRV